MKEFANDGVKFKICRIAGRKIKYWKVLFQQNRSSSNFVKKKKKRHVAETYWWGSTNPSNSSVNQIFKLQYKVIN